VLVHPGYPGLPSRDISVAPHHRRVLPRRCIVRIDEHGSKDRVKDASRSACNGVPCLRPVPTRILRRTTALPSLAFLRTSAVTGAFDTCGGTADTDDEPTKAFVPATHREACRFPENRDAFCRHDTRRSFFEELLFSPRDCSLSAFAPALSLTPPTLFPQVGESALLGIASVRVRSPAIHDGPPAGGTRVQTPFLPSESRLGLTTQACRLAHPTRPSTGADCPARTDVGRSA